MKTTPKLSLPAPPAGFNSSHRAPELGQVHDSTFCAEDLCDNPDHWQQADDDLLRFELHAVRRAESGYAQ
jgi:hypothetical protein